MNILIIKLGAAGDVLRTTSLLNILPGEIDWITSDENNLLLTGNPRINNSVPWSRASSLANSRYDLVLNLEDSVEVGRFINSLKYKELFGSYIDKSDKLTYTESAKNWFDLGLISRFGKIKADELKFINRRSYQDIVFSCLGYTFNGEKYFCPQTAESDLTGDIAISNTAGPVWPMKRWAFYTELKTELEETGFKVNILPARPSLWQHIADVRNHKCLISGDSLPMHIALGSDLKCVTLFLCTSPWEIHDYSVQTKIVSPLLEKYFYKRHYDVEATTCVPLNDVREAVFKAFNGKEDGLRMA